MMLRITFCIKSSGGSYMPREYVYEGLTRSQAYRKACEQLNQEVIDIQLVDYRIEEIKVSK